MNGSDIASDEEIRVIVAGEHRAFVTDLLDRVNATGYTIVGNVSGKGHHGVREAHFMFSEQESLEMIMTVVPEEKVEPILAGLRPLFERHSGVFVADVAVSRRRILREQEQTGLTVSRALPLLSSRQEVVYNGRLVAAQEVLS